MMRRLFLGTVLSLAGWVAIGYVTAGLPGYTYLIAAGGVLLIQIGTSFIGWAMKERSRENRHVYNLDHP